jgi:hypothetical protein
MMNWKKKDRKRQRKRENKNIAPSKQNAKSKQCFCFLSFSSSNYLSLQHKMRVHASLESSLISAYNLLSLAWKT